MKYVKLVYLVIVFHLPVWRWKYKNHKYRFLNDMPRWMQEAIRIRNDYESDNGLLDCFYWAKAWRFYVRKFHSHPMENVFACSDKHLFVFKRFKSVKG